ncbi:M23 family metallopeptidase [Clostridiales Family XIII bacterium ASD5510]|uniref:M23 family metallopeptidase n=1 Tax=Hominibacterium faecale TaxID=2839743 RepID=A0A9J6QSC4_9FIRM|nr:M23 family metallopeptidase [Hominibacterium faecale]MCU7378909.1 M23 family metallopeptidase [Hominibacterium faecale]
MKRKAVLVLAACVLLSGLLALLIFVSVLAAILSQTSPDAQLLDAQVACTITGTRQKQDLNLTLTYDGLSVKGITGIVSGSGNFSAATKASGKQKTKMALPEASAAKRDVQTFMCYTAVTATSSDQYKLLNSSGAKDVGIYRKVNGRYVVALGSFYGSKIGTNYILQFQQTNGTVKTISAILGDQKADKDTDAKHQYHTIDGSIVEFVTAKGTSQHVSATQQQINRDFGTLIAIYRSGKAAVKLEGTIKETSISITGEVDGVALSASGTVKAGKVHAEGFIGQNAEDAGGGIYTGGKFGWPVPGHTRLSSDYEYRNCPFHGRELHSGLDIPAPLGTQVLAAADGTVRLSRFYGSYGNAVILSHGSALFTLYGHNSSLLVAEGTKVKKGQPIALVGSTGSSTGNHCHFEVRKGGSEYRNNTSPWPYLKKKP